MPDLGIGASWQRKFRRAQQHLEQLTLLVPAFLETEPYQAVEEIKTSDRSPGPNSFPSVSHTWRAVIRQKPPGEWSPIIGDCLNNLRASLDHMAWALADGRGTKTAFPIFAKASEYKRLTRGRHLRYVRKDAHAFIEGMQPYHVPKPLTSWLFLLDRLTNDDKHRELLGTEVGVVGIHVDSPVGPMVRGDLLTFEFEAHERVFENGATIVKYHTSNPSVTVPLVFTFDVALDPQGPTLGGRLLTTLANLSFVVSILLREMERLFFADRLANETPLPLEGRAEFVGA